MNKMDNWDEHSDWQLVVEPPKERPITKILIPLLICLLGFDITVYLYGRNLELDLYKTSQQIDINLNTVNIYKTNRSNNDSVVLVYDNQILKVQKNQMDGLLTDVENMQNQVNAAARENRVNAADLEKLKQLHDELDRKLHLVSVAMKMAEENYTKASAPGSRTATRKKELQNTLKSKRNELNRRESNCKSV